MINDPRSQYVFEKLVEAGAPEEILYTAKAHVGTDKLKLVVRNLRKKIISLGADIRFSTCMTDMEIRDGRVSAIIVEDTSSQKRTQEQNPPSPLSQGGVQKESQKERIECDTLILAIGHSARDTYEMAYAK